MTTIYRNASSVVIFLSEEEQDNKNLSYTALFSFFNREVGEYNLGERDESEEEEESQEEENRRFEEAIQTTGIQKTLLLRTFFDFCSREWWNGLWVLQEYAIASRHPIFVLGTCKTSASSLLRDMHMLENQHRKAFRGEEQRIRDYKNTPYYPMTQAFGVVNYRFPENHGQNHESWLYHLLLSAHSWCRERCDIIYGRRVLLPPMLQQLLKPDYGLTIEQLYETVPSGCWCLREVWRCFGTSRCVCLPGRRRGFPTSPSPDTCPT